GRHGIALRCNCGRLADWRRGKHGRLSVSRSVQGFDVHYYGHRASGSPHGPVRPRRFDELRYTMTTPSLTLEKSRTPALFDTIRRHRVLATLVFLFILPWIMPNYSVASHI